jgi:hypothetical protein
VARVQTPAEIEHALEKVKNCWCNKSTFYLDTSGGQNSNPCIMILIVSKIRHRLALDGYFQEIGV